MMGRSKNLHFCKKSLSASRVRGLEGEKAMNTEMKTMQGQPGTGASTWMIPIHRAILFFFLLLLAGIAGCGGGGSESNDPKSADTPTLSPTPGRFSFRGMDDPVGFVPDVSSQVPNPPVATYNPDGTRVDCPAETTTGASYTYPGLSSPIATVNFVRKKLNGSGCMSSIHFPAPNDTSYTVYSTVPQQMTIAYGYAHPYPYFDQTQLPSWSNGTIAPPSANDSINCGSTSATAAGTSQTGDNTPVLVAVNSNSQCQQWSQFYIPYLPNTKSQNGLSDLDHKGLTENIVWNADEYMQVGNDPNYFPQAEHLFQYGWAFDPRNVGQTITWNALNNIASGGPSQPLLSIEPGQPNSSGNSLIWTVQGKYWCNDPVQCASQDFSKIQQLLPQFPEYPFPDPTTWLKNGAFVPYQAMPGFQRNLLREFTPSGTFAILNNSSGLFVRKDGSVEFPLDRNGEPYPPVIQTWDGNQQFVALNLTSGAITATNDSYPGDEVYYLGNTFLPNQAGVVTRWAYYPWTALDPNGEFKPFFLNGTIKHIADQRLSDGWLGMKDDLPENVLAWNNGTQVGQIDTDLVGGQARKPYMFSADEEFGNDGQIPLNKNTPFPPANVNLRHILQIEHSNSFNLWRVTNADGAQMQQTKMYKTSLYATDTNGNYVLIASLTWTFMPNWGFTDDTQPVVWASGKADGHGAWMQSLQINPLITSGQNLPPGWVWNPNADTNGLGQLQFANGNVSIKALKATWTGSVNWGNQVSWNEGGPGNGSTPRANQAGANVVRFQITGNAGDTQTKFLITMEPL